MACYLIKLCVLYPRRIMGGYKPDDRYADASEDLYVYVVSGHGIKAGKKSYALNFVLQNSEKTLTDEEINKVMNKLIGAYEREIGAKLR